VPLQQGSVARRALRLHYEDLCRSDDAWRGLSERLARAGLASAGTLTADGLLPGLREGAEARPGRGATGTLSAEDQRRIRRRVGQFGLLPLVEAGGAG